MTVFEQVLKLRERIERLVGSCSVFIECDCDELKISVKTVDGNEESITYILQSNYDRFKEYEVDSFVDHIAQSLKHK